MVLFRSVFLTCVQSTSLFRVFATYRFQSLLLERVTCEGVPCTTDTRDAMCIWFGFDWNRWCILVHVGKTFNRTLRRGLLSQCWDFFRPLSVDVTLNHCRRVVTWRLVRPCTFCLWKLTNDFASGLKNRSVLCSYSRPDCPSVLSAAWPVGNPLTPLHSGLNLCEEETYGCTKKKWPEIIKWYKKKRVYLSQFSNPND